MIRAVVLLVVLASCKEQFEDYATKSKMSEARLMLNRITKLAKVYAIEKGQFPVGKVGPTPEDTCCGRPDHKCPADPSTWSDQVWRDLDFQVDEPHRFRYSYESDGTTFTARAVGDLDCDASMITYTATGKYADGIAETVIDDKPAGND
jgi:hypothetical protein